MRWWSVDEELNHFLETVLCTVKTNPYGTKTGILTENSETDGKSEDYEPDILSVKRLDLVLFVLPTNYRVAGFIKRGSEWPHSLLDLYVHPLVSETHSIQRSTGGVLEQSFGIGEPLRVWNPDPV